MAKITLYDSSRLPSVGSAPKADPNDPVSTALVGAGAALSRSASTFARDAERRRKEQEAAEAKQKTLTDATYANSAVAQLHDTMTERFSQAKLNVTPGAKDFTNNMLALFDQEVATVLENPPSPEAREKARARMLTYRATLHQQADAFEIKQRASAHVAASQDALQLNSNALIRQPELFAEVIAQHRANIDSLESIVDPSVRDTLISDGERTLAGAAMAGWLEKDPVKAGQILESGAMDRFLTAEDSRKFRAQVDAALKIDYTLKLAKVRTQIEDNLASMATNGELVHDLPDIATIIPTNEGIKLQEGYAAKLAAVQNIYPAVEALKHNSALFNADDWIEFTAELGIIPEGKNFANELEVLNTLETTRSRLAKAALDDPINYLRDTWVAFDVEHPSFMGTDDPRDYTLKVISQQQAMGLPPSAMRILSDAERTEVAAKLQTLTGTELQAYALELQARGHYQVDGHIGTDLLFRELQADENLPPVYKAAISYAGTPVFNLIAQSLHYSESDYTKLLSGRNLTSADVQRTVSSTLEPWMEAVTSGAPNAETVGFVRDMSEIIKSMSYATMITQADKSLNDAVEQSYNSVITDYYALADTYVIPKVHAESELIRDRAIELINGFNSRFAIDQGGIPNPITGELFRPAPLQSMFTNVFTEEQLRKKTIRAIADNSRWRNTGDQNGIELIHVFTGGRVDLVRDEDGNPLRFTFDQLSGLDYTFDVMPKGPMARTQQ